MAKATNAKSTLTLRLETDEEIEALEDLKEFLGKKTATKAIIQAIMSYVPQHRSMSKEIQEQSEIIHSLNDDLKQLLQFKDSLNAFLSFDSHAKDIDAELDKYN